MVHKYFHCELDQGHARNRLNSSGLNLTKIAFPIHRRQRKSPTLFRNLQAVKKKLFPGNLPEYEEMFKVHREDKPKAWLCC